MYDAIIVGGGPAGLTSAIYLRRANKKVLVLEANVCGGQIVTAKSIENYPGYINISGYEFAENIKNQALNLGAEIKYETVLRVDEDKKVDIVDPKELIMHIQKKFYDLFFQYNTCTLSLILRYYNFYSLASLLFFFHP